MFRGGDGAETPGFGLPELLVGRGPEWPTKIGGPARVGDEEVAGERSMNDMFDRNGVQSFFEALRISRVFTSVLDG